jgi:hypothetical protein
MQPQTGGGFEAKSSARVPKKLERFGKRLIQPVLA